MIRTIVSIKDDDKTWLDLKAAEEKVSRAELIRRAVRLFGRTSRLGRDPPRRRRSSSGSRCPPDRRIPTRPR